MDLQVLQTYATPAPELPAERLATWALIGRGKSVMDQELAKKEAEISVVLRDYATMTAVELSDAIKKYKAIQSEMTETRKNFTRFLDAATQQCMAVEKRYDPLTNELFKKATARELELRIEAQKKLTAAQDKKREETQLSAHISNEYFRLAADFRTDIKTIIHNAYMACLNQKTPAANIGPAKAAAISAIQALKIGSIKNFSRVHLSVEEATAIFNSVKKPDWNGIYNEEIKGLDAKFAMYEQDLQSADVVKAQTELSFNNELAEVKQELDTTVAGNNLMASATAMIIPDAGYKGVDEVTSIVIKDDDENFVVAIITCFVANFQRAFPRVRVKKYSALNVEQMAKALDAASIKVESPYVQYQTTQK